MCLCVYKCGGVSVTYMHICVSRVLGDGNDQYPELLEVYQILTTSSVLHIIFVIPSLVGIKLIQAIHSVMPQPFEAG